MEHTVQLQSSKSEGKRTIALAMIYRECHRMIRYTAQLPDHYESSADINAIQEIESSMSTIGELLVDYIKNNQRTNQNGENEKESDRALIAGCDIRDSGLTESPWKALDNATNRLRELITAPTPSCEPPVHISRTRSIERR